MWATVSCPSSSATPRGPRPTFGTSLSIRRNPKSLKLQSCLFDFPLASRIMVRNLSYSTGESCLQKEFQNFGQIAEVKLVKDEATKRSKGYAFIQYTCQDDAMLALENMDRKNFDGRVIYVELAKPVNNVFGGYPRTSGPPLNGQHVQKEDE